MRDLSRIPVIQDLINEIWLIYPDMRYLQLISNIEARFSQENDDRGKIENVQDDGYVKITYDMFHVEDDELINFLTKIRDNGGFR